MYNYKTIDQLYTYKTLFNTIDDYKVIFLDLHMVILSPFATVMNCSLDLLTFKLKSKEMDSYYQLLLNQDSKVGLIVLNVFLPFMNRVYNLENFQVPLYKLSYQTLKKKSQQICQRDNQKIPI